MLAHVHHSSDIEFVIYAAIFGLIWVVYRIKDWMRASKWAKIAPELGLSYERHYLQPSLLVGEYDNVSVVISEPTGNSFVIKADLGPQTPPGLAIISHEIRNGSSNRGARVAVSSAKALDVGLPYLQEVCYVGASNAAEARRYLSRPGIEDMLLELFSSKTAHISGGTLTYVEPGTGEYAFEFEQPLEQVAKIVHALDGAERPATRPVVVGV